jgi:hypothetical protein
MKALLISLMIGLLAFNTDKVYGQTEGKLFPKYSQDTVKNIFKFNPLSLVGSGRASLNYERYLGKHRSLNVGVSTSDLTYLLRWYGFRGNYWETNIAMRFYLNKKKMPLEGIYISPQLSFSNSSIDVINFNGGYRDYWSHSSTLTANFLVGKQIINNRGLTLDLFTGLGINYSKGNPFYSGLGSSSSNSFSRTGFNIPLGVKVGFGW